MDKNDSFFKTHNFYQMLHLAWDHTILMNRFRRFMLTKELINFGLINMKNLQN
jgi:hypothetical protein